MRAAEPVDPTTMTGKIMCGYQGWFRAKGDGTNSDYFHYGPRDFGPGKCSIDLWPDMSEMDDDEKYPTSFKYADGSDAYVFSSANRKTVVRHFKWMEDYGLDGVFLQRFIGTTRSDSSRKKSGVIMENVRAGAEKHNRTWAIMYDLSGANPGDLMSVLVSDWKRLIDEDGIRKDRMYLHHEGKPVVAVWGVGFGDSGRKYTVKECLELVTFLKNDPKYGGNTVMIGVPAYWRELRGDASNDPLLHEVIRKADIVSPWAVGRFGSLQDAEKYVQRTAAEDLVWCQENGTEYLPVVFPGFSWHNMLKGRGKEAKLDQIPRLKGQFLSAQIKGHTNNGATMIYQAMFDEMDEGTAIFKCTNNPPVGESPFLTFDGEKSDFYLKLVGDAATELKQTVKQAAAQQPFPGKKSRWHGYDQYQFEVANRLCRVVVPKKVAEGKPWSWRMVFWDHYNKPETALLEQGYHIAFIDCSDWLGSPKNLEERAAFYKLLTEKYGFSKMPNLIGLSRGGLCALRWAITNPDKVSCLYIDAPVCDLRVWPGGGREGKTNTSNNEMLKHFLDVYKITQEEIATYPGNPIDAFKPLVDKKIPILSVCGDADTAAPFDKHTKPFAEKFKAAGGTMDVIVKPGVGHHPHGLDDPTPIVEFIMKNTKK